MRSRIGTERCSVFGKRKICSEMCSVRFGRCSAPWECSVRVRVRVRVQCLFVFMCLFACFGERLFGVRVTVYVRVQFVVRGSAVR